MGSTDFNSMGDVIFHFGEVADHMIIISLGLVKYSWGEDKQEHLGVGRWLSEAVLWLHWAHRGALVAQEDTRCSNLNAEAFQQIVNQFELASIDPKKYAAAFLRSLNQTSGSE